MMHRIGIMVFDHMTMLDASGPAEVFHHADPQGSHYEVLYISAAGGAVTSTSGMELSTVAAADAGQVDTLVVAGGPDLMHGPIDPALLLAVSTIAQGASRVASVCTGAFILAALGYLDGRRATTHWRHAHLLAQRYPLIHVEPDVIHVRDDWLLTSAGISAGIDLALAMVETDLGVETARETARELVMFMQRPGGQSQFSAALRTPLPAKPHLRELTQVIAADPGGPHTVASMAAYIQVSPRHLNRIFQQELGVSPARWLEQLRVDMARPLVLKGHTLTRVAQLSGLGSDETLRRAFARHLGTTPSQYRERFGSTQASRDWRRTEAH